eukprot:tig00021494_g21920.t1
MAANRACHRKLKALAYPRASQFTTEDEEVRALVVWLEDMKIRHYPIEGREPLRTFNAEWGKVFAKYLAELECPLAVGAEVKPPYSAQLVDWIVGHAVYLEHQDRAKEVNEAAKQFAAQQKAAGRPKGPAASSSKASGPPVPLDLGSEELRGALAELAAVLKQPTEGRDAAALLQAAADVIERKFSAAAVAAATGKGPKPVPGTPDPQLPADLFPLGFETGDPLLDKAARVLRLLHTRDLRELQTRINQVITDSRLGKVGF